MENLVTFNKLSSIFQGKKVFITGHTGFKGAWLTICLHLLGANLKGYSLAPEYGGGLFDFLQPLDIIDSVIADIRDKNKLEEELKTFQPDFIFHLAAQPLVRRSYEIPAETFEINVSGTANLLENIIQLDGKCTIVIITTDKVYENKEQDILYTENDILGGYDPYSASKACTEIVSSSFRSSFFNPTRYENHHKAIASARAGNVIGGGDWNQNRIIPDIVRSLEKNEVIRVRNPKAVRPWQHVLEPISGYLVLGALLNEQPLEFSEAYNFGPLPDDHLTVKNLVELAIRVWGEGKWEDISDPTERHEAGLLKLSVDKAGQQLRWKPKLRAEKAIEWTIDWYKKPASQKMDLAFQQARDYFNL